MRANHILLVEDNEDLGELMVLMLSDLGYCVRYAARGDDAWLDFQEHGARVVITDGHMPGIGGLELARRVKQASPTTPVIMAAAHASDEAASVCDTVLTKPVPIADLVGALEHAIEASCPSALSEGVPRAVLSPG